MNVVVVELPESRGHDILSHGHISDHLPGQSTSFATQYEPIFTPTSAPFIDNSSHKFPFFKFEKASPVLFERTIYLSRSLLEAPWGLLGTQPLGGIT